jgi:hypothetical protein
MFISALSDYGRPKPRNEYDKIFRYSCEGLKNKLNIFVRKINTNGIDFD